MILKSCKKADIAPQDAATTKAAAIKAIKAKYGDVSAGIVYNINKTATEYFYKDANGQRVSLHGAGAVNGPTPTPCTYDCSTAPNASWLFPFYTLDYVERFYKCESVDQSEVNVQWTVSVPFSIGVSSIGGQFSSGYVRFTDATPTVTTFTAPYTDMTITYVSTDPTCLTNNLYTVSYKVDNIPDSYFASGTTIAAAVDLANNCNLTFNLVSSAYVNGPSFSQNGYFPCNRIDKVYINPYNPVVLMNAAGICTHPSGFTYSDYQQFEYRKVTVTGDDNWVDQTSPIRWAAYYYGPGNIGSETPAFTPSESAYLTYITASSGQWLFRYRNVLTGSCNVISAGSPGGNWGNPALWFTEVKTF